MKLYHGTSAANLNSILDRGLMPRSKKDSRWESNPSRADCVYLTDAYAPYFCFAGDKPDKMGLVIEVDVDRMSDERLLPDEDACEQIMRGKDNINGDLEERVKRGDTWWKMPMEHEVLHLNGSVADRPIGTFGRDKKERTRESHPAIANRTTVKHNDERNIADLIKQADRALAGTGIAGGTDV